MSKNTYHVKHILVQHSYEAEDLLKKLKAGEKFETLATKYSTCPSRNHGGDLGVLRSGQADENFEEASLALKPGQISTSVVRTRFGYHLIFRLN